MKVVVTSPVWSLNGVNVFSANLVRSLLQRGLDAQLLLTWPEMSDPKPLPLPSGVKVERLPVGEDASWPARWRAMIRYLTERAPCIYLPNYDFWHSCVCPVLPRSVATVGIVHSDDPQHYEHVARLGCYWDAVVAVSHAIAAEVSKGQPALSPRLSIIPYGVEAPEQPRLLQASENSPLRVLYHGVLKQSQKRVLDLAGILRILVAWNVPVELTVVGAGPEREQLHQAAAELVSGGQLRILPTLPHADVPDLLANNDAFILTSEFEGLPIALLEAMAWGCVPVVSDIRSGIPELVHDGANGYRVSPGDLGGFAARLALLQRDPALRWKLGQEAARTIREGGYRLEDMTDRYVALFSQVAGGGATEAAFKRPRGRIAPPPGLPWTGYLPERVRRAVRRLRNREGRAS